MNCRGKAIAPASAVKYDARLMLGADGRVCCLVYTAVNDNNASVSTDNDHTDYSNSEFQEELAQLNIAGPLGSLPRTISFENGWSFIPDDNQQIDEWQRQLKPPSKIHKWEASYLAIAISLLLTIVIGGLFFTSGLPLVSKLIARVIPTAVHQHLGEQSLAIMDDDYFSASQLTASEKHQLTLLFQELVSKTQPHELTPKLHFRSLPDSANAFTLTDGTIILTDELIKLADNNNEIAAVLLHELGHLHHNHLLNRLVESSILSVLASYLVGDAAGIGDTLASAATLLLTLNHSQQAELEADRFAARQLARDLGTVQPMQDILFKLQTDQTKISETVSVPGWLSTHPNTDRRIRALEAFNAPELP